MKQFFLSLALERLSPKEDSRIGRVCLSHELGPVKQKGVIGHTIVTLSTGIGTDRHEQTV